MPRLRIGFWIDPLDSLQVGHDTTFALMLEAQNRGHDVLHFEAKDLKNADGITSARAKRSWLKADPSDRSQLVEETVLPVSAFDALFLRKDPPADVHYQHVTRMLEMTGGDRRPLYVNEPAAIRGANEKLFALQFPELCPRTLVTSELKEFQRFREENGDVVVKPLDGFGGRGVFYVRTDDPNAEALFEVTTGDRKEPAIVQEFLPASKQGDKRIVLLDGEPIGAINRVGSAFKCNLAAGGRPVRTELSDDDRAVCARIGPTLRQLGLYFVGIDVIGGKLTEVNVTSPTGVMEIDKADRVRLETEVIRFVERRASVPEEGRREDKREQVAPGVEQR